MNNESTSLVDFIESLKKQNLSDKEIKKRYNNYIENRAREKRIPLHGKLELTPYCNLDCKMCYVHLNSEQFCSDKLISVETWKRLIDEAHSAGMLYTTLTGGECLIYPGFDEIYLYLRTKGIVPCILSNGLLMNEKRIEFLKKYPPSLIQITLYGSSDDAYEKVTGHRVFKTIYHNLEMLREAHFKVAMSLTPSSYMRDDIRPLQKVAESLEIPYSINANLIAPRDNTGRQLEDLELDQYIEIYKVWKELKQEELIPVDPAEIPSPSTDGKKAYGLQCGGGTSSFTIQYNGKMSPCPSLSEVTTEPLKDGFLNAWHQLNDLVSKYPMPAECPECVYHDYCILCPAIHNSAKNHGHCDPHICERTRRLIQEGFMPIPDKAKESHGDS